MLPRSLTLCPATLQLLLFGGTLRPRPKSRDRSETAHSYETQTFAAGRWQSMDADRTMRDAPVRRNAPRAIMLRGSTSAPEKQTNKPEGRPDLDAFEQFSCCWVSQKGVQWRFRWEKTPLNVESQHGAYREIAPSGLIGVIDCETMLSGLGWRSKNRLHWKCIDPAKDIGDIQRSADDDGGRRAERSAHMQHVKQLPILDANRGNVA